MKASEILAGALERLSRRGGWTRGAMARTKAGNRIGPQELPAVSWCSMGAIRGAITPLAWRPSREARYEAEDYLAAAAGLPSASYIVPWNDGPGQTKRRVIATFKRAHAAAVAAGN